MKDLKLSIESCHHGQGLHTDDEFHLITYFYETLIFFKNSNLAYSLLGNCLIEKIYDSMSFEDYVEKFILEPLEMTNTGFEFTTEYVDPYIKW